MKWTVFFQIHTTNWIIFIDHNHYDDDDFLAHAATNKTNKMRFIVPFKYVFYLLLLLLFPFSNIFLLPEAKNKFENIFLFLVGFFVFGVSREQFEIVKFQNGKHTDHKKKQTISKYQFKIENIWFYIYYIFDFKFPSLDDFCNDTSLRIRHNWCDKSHHCREHNSVCFSFRNK